MQDPEAFLADPGAWADPVRAAALLTPGLKDATAQRLMTSPRTAARASRLLCIRLRQGNFDALHPADRRLVLASEGSLPAVAVAAGAIWHAARVRTLLRAGEISAFAERHGAGVRALALRHAALSPEASPAADADLYAAIARDGAGCVAAWIAALPGWAAGRIRLKWANDTPPPADPALQARAAVIVRAVAGDGAFP